MSKSWLSCLLILCVGCDLSLDIATPRDQNDARSSAISDERISDFISSLSSRSSDYDPVPFLESPAPNLDAPAEQWQLLLIQELDDGALVAVQQKFARLKIHPDVDKGASAWAYDSVMLAQQTVGTSGGEGVAPSQRSVRSLQRMANQLAGADANGRLWVNDQQLRSSVSEDCSQDFTLDGGLLDKMSFSAYVCSPLFDGAGIQAKSFPLSERSTNSDANGRLRAGWMEHAWGALPPANGAVVLDRLWLQLAEEGAIELIRRKRRNHTGPVRTRGEYRKLPLVAPSDLDGVISIEDLDEQISDLSGLNYPKSWRVVIAELELDVFLTPFVDMAEQAFMGERTWQGAVTISGSHTGVGFVLHHAKPVP